MNLQECPIAREFSLGGLCRDLVNFRVVKPVCDDNPDLSTFRDWPAELASSPNVCEMALAHGIAERMRQPVGAMIYSGSAELMDVWTRYCGYEFLGQKRGGGEEV